MKIGMILDAPFPADYRVEKEAKTLVEAGHQVTLFCLNTRHEKEMEEYNGFRIARYPTNRLEYKLSALAYTVPFYHWLMGRKIDAFVEAYKPETLHIHDMVVAPAAIRVARKKNLRVILDLHENRPAIMKEYRHLKKFPGKYLIDLSIWNKRQGEIVAEADKVIVVTDLAKRELMESSGKSSDDIIVLPNTPAIAFREYPIDESLSQKMAKSFNLLYIGDTSERRGTLDMLKVVSVLKSEIPELALWIVGTSSFDAELREKASGLGISEFVHFEGWQSERLFPSYIKGSHVCLSPLKRNPHHDTTFANKIFQYMSLGRPSLVSNCPAQAELISNEGAGLVYDMAKPGDFAQSIRDLYHDAGLRERLGQRALMAVQNRWNWENTSQPLIDLYR